MVIGPGVHVDATMPMCWHPHSPCPPPELVSLGNGLGGGLLVEDLVLGTGQGVEQAQGVVVLQVDTLLQVPAPRGIELSGASATADVFLAF
jgi:hypothetical protein